MIASVAVSIAIGAAGAVVGFTAGPVVDAWLWLLVGFLIFAGIGQGMLAWAAAFRTANVRWVPAVNRLAHSAIVYGLVSYGVLVALMLGARAFVPWIAHPMPEKQAWLNLPFMQARLLGSMGLLLVLNYVMVRMGLCADAKVASGGEVSRKDHYRLNAVSIAAVLAYVIAFTLVAWDLIMSLNPHWISTMFAPYFFVTSMYTGMAMLIILASATRHRLGAERYLHPQQFQDMGNLMLGFGLFSMGLFFAQYLTIWYGNLPLETDFIILRYFKSDWAPLAWVSFGLGYGLPFVILQSRWLKRTPALVAPVALLGLIGVALERYVLVVPSILPEKVAMAPAPGLVLVGFAGAFALCVTLFLRHYAPVSAADEALPEPEPLEVTT